MPGIGQSIISNVIKLRLSLDGKVGLHNLTLDHKDKIKVIRIRYVYKKDNSLPGR